jgi:ABC-type multidrug transport system permease subunit
MNTIPQIISKNLKLLIRSKSSALIVILAPLLLIFLVGLAFDNANTFGLTIGVHTPTFTDNVNTFLEELTNNDFRIIKYDTETECVEDIKTGATNTCVIFPENFVFDSNEQQELVFYVDQSKINLVWMIMDTLNVEFGSNAKEISRNLAGVLIEKLQTSQNQLQNKQDSLLQIKGTNENTNTRAQSIASNLNGLDLSYNEDALQIAKAKETLETARNTISDKLSKARKNITSAKSEVGENNKLDDALTSVAKAKLALNTGNESLGELADSLAAIEAELINTKQKLVSADEARVSSVTALIEIKSELDQSIQNLAEIETTFNTIIGEINSIKVTNPEAIAEPIVTDIRPLTAEQTYLNYLFPSLIILVVMFISMLLGTTLVMMEKHSPAYFRNFITPTRDITFVVATYLTNMLLVLIQMSIILIIAAIFFSAQLLPTLHGVIGVLLLSATFFTFVGMFIGYLFTSEETATLATISTGSLFLLLSNVIIPLESMPSTIRSIASYNPFVLSEQLLREVVLFQTKFISVWVDVVYLAAYSTALFLIIWGTQEFMSRNYIQKVVYKHHKKKRIETLNRENDHMLKAKESKAPAKQPETKTKKSPEVKNPKRNYDSSKEFNAELDRVNEELRNLPRR